MVLSGRNATLPEASYMVQLVMLVRHADALNATEDPSRALSPLGRHQASKVAGWLADLGLRVDEIWHSGKTRAEQTAEAIATALDLEREKLRAVNGLSPNDDVEAVARGVEAEERSLALVGHLPFMGRLASRLLAGDAHRLALRFPAAGVILLARREGRWELIAFIHPEVLPS